MQGHAHTRAESGSKTHQRADQGLSICPIGSVVSSYRVIVDIACTPKLSPPEAGSDLPLAHPRSQPIRLETPAVPDEPPDATRPRQCPAEAASVRCPTAGVKGARICAFCRL